MGMFDIVDDIIVYCPQCGKIIKDEFQTKSFYLLSLHHYKIGDELPKDRSHEDHIEIHGICDNCKLLVYVYLQVINDILTDKFY